MFCIFSAALVSVTACKSVVLIWWATLQYSSVGEEHLKIQTKVDYSPLQTQLEKYIQNTTNYISMKPGFASRMSSEAKV